MRALRPVVIHPPVSVARDFIDYPFFSDLGAVQLAAVLDATLVDAFALPASDLRFRPDGRAHLGAPIEDVIARVPADADAIVVAYTPFHRPPARDDLLGALVATLRARHSDAVLLLADCYQSGQHYVEADGDAVLAAYPEVDAWVKYEAEITVPALLDRGHSSDGKRPRGVYRGASPDLDALPFPAWDRINIEHYFNFHARVVAGLGRGPWSFPIVNAAAARTLPLVTSRGCPFTCAHCSSNPDRRPGEPKLQRRYSEARLREYLRALVQQYRATRLHLLDELVNVNERHFDTVLSELSDLDIRFEIPNGMRADYLEPRHFAAMRDRVTTVSVSAESGVQRVVDQVVGKRLDLAAITRAAESAHQAGVPLMIHFMIGLPGETAAEVNGTLAFAMDLWDRFGARPAVQFATPLPGTALARDRRLPIVPPDDGDWGPRFQTQPSQPDALVPPDILARFKWTFDERLRASQGPRKVIMNVTYLCNNHCTFCATGTRTQVHGHPTRQREHLDKYRAMGVRMVDFDGGEPTLNPELIPLIRYARAIGYERIHVTTNGRLCYYPDFAAKLVGSGLTTLAFSLHGADAQTHAQQVGVAEAFEQTTAGIKNCVAAAAHRSDIEFGLNITLTKGNYRQQEEVAQLAWDLGLRWMNIQFLTPFGRATRMVAPDTAEAAVETRRLIDRWSDRMKLQVINLPFCFLPGYERYLVGDLQKLERHMIFVNNDDVNLAEYLAERRTRKPVCAGCPHAVFCGGFYDLDTAPEPPWLIRAEDLVRPIPR